jgi:hypothetical protein
MPCPPRPPLLDHSDYTWRRIHVTQFLINQFHTHTKLLTIRFLDVAKLTSCELSFPSVALKISSLETWGLKFLNATDRIRVLVPRISCR